MLTWVSYYTLHADRKPPAPASILPRPSALGFIVAFQRARQVDRFLGHCALSCWRLRISWVRVWRSCVLYRSCPEPDGGNRPVVHVARQQAVQTLTVLLINPAIAVLKIRLARFSNCSLRRCSLLITGEFYRQHVAVRLPSAWLLHQIGLQRGVNTLQAAHFVIEYSHSARQCSLWVICCFAALNSRPSLHVQLIARLFAAHVDNGKQPANCHTHQRNNCVNHDWKSTTPPDATTYPHKIELCCKTSSWKGISCEALRKNTKGRRVGLQTGEENYSRRRAASTTFSPLGFQFVSSSQHSGSLAGAVNDNTRYHTGTQALTCTHVSRVADSIS